MKKYKVIYDMGHTIDGFIASGGLEGAKDAALEIWTNWIAEAQAEGQDPKEELYDSCVWVEQFIDGEWEEIWCPEELL